MKANGIYTVLYRIVLFILVLLYSLLVFGQPDYTFSGSVLISGTDRQVNAQYRFNNVRTNVDARVTITALTGGISLQSFDNNSGGFNEALQPTLTVPGGTSGYLELRIDFYVAGTNLTTPSVQTEVPITPIDVDGQDLGSGNVNEFDLVYMPNGYYMFDGLGGELAITRPMGGWWIQGTNTGTIDYAGIDTAVKRVMFSVMNATVTSVTFRVGATNTSTGSSNRLRSVYFRKFNYPNPVLPVTDLKEFNGTTRNDVVSLNWELYKENSINYVELEKSTNGIDFRSEAVYLVNPETERYNYHEKEMNTQVYYRLKLISSNGKITQSQVLSFKPELHKATGLKVYPTIVQTSFNAAINTDRAEQATLEVIDLGGRTMIRKNLQLTLGLNNVQVLDMARLSPGSYFVKVRGAQTNYQSTIIKQ